MFNVCQLCHVGVQRVHLHTYVRFARAYFELWNRKKIFENEMKKNSSHRLHSVCADGMQRTNFTTEKHAFKNRMGDST